MSETAGFEFVEGATSDLAFVARGDSCEEALATATRALLAATVEDPAAVRAVQRRRVVLEEAELDLLLLRLLNELVYLRDAEGLLLWAQTLSLDRGPGGYRLEAELAGEPWCAERHRPASEVKAATAHGLALRPADGGWEAHATLDV